MRTMITSVVVSVLLGGFTGSAAQLPPDILADSYLLRAEQADFAMGNTLWSS